MRGRLPLVGMLVGSVTLLVSLYLPWATNTTVRCTLQGFDCGSFLSSRSYDGWLSAFGGAAGLLAVGVIVTIAVRLAGRQAAARVPLATGSLALLFFAVMDAAVLRNQARFYAGYYNGAAHVGYGAYVGVASAVVAVVAAVGLPWAELGRVSPSAVVGAMLAPGLLGASLALQLTLHVTSFPAGAVASLGAELAFITFQVMAVCALALFGLPLLLRGGSPRVLRAGAGAIAVLTAAYLLPLRGAYADWPWELWLFLACAVALVVLAAATGGPLGFTQPSFDTAAMVAAATLVLVSLFLPWETSDCPPLRCIRAPLADGWTVGRGALAGTLAVLLLIGIVGYGRTVLEFALGTVIYVLSVGLTVAGYTVDFGYGAWIGFAGAALLLVLAVRRVSPIPHAGSLIRVVPLAACLGFLTFAVASSAGRSTFAMKSPWQQSLLTAVAIVLALRLFLQWWSDEPHESEEVVLLPLGLLTLTALDLIWIRNSGISWEGWVAVVLCLLLAGCGWVERNGGGLNRLRIPDEIWRVDRLPPVED